MREIFEELRRNALYGASELEWLAEVVALLPKLEKGKRHTAEQMVEAARKATVRCHDCRGTGVYCWGAVVNGKPTHTGPCFRCCGKGRQGQEDFKRNWGYDNFHRKVS